MSSFLNVNNKALIEHTKRLEAFNKKGLPLAIRQTLNSAAFDVKSNTMPKSANSEFTNRKPNFFKANSRVEIAKGNNISSMKAIVGFVGKDQAVKDLKSQEKGGFIEGRAFIANDLSRQGASTQGMVKTQNRIGAIGPKIINAEKVSKGKSKKQKFVRAAFMAKKLGGNKAFVLGNKYGAGVQTLSRIHSIKRLKNSKLKVKRTAIYTYRAGRKVKIDPTGFMKRASLESGLKMEDHFIRHATKILRNL